MTSSTPTRRARNALTAGLLLLSLPIWLGGCGGGGGRSEGAGGGGGGGVGDGGIVTPPPDQPPPAAVAGLRCTGPKSTGWCWQAPQPWAPVVDDVVFTDALTGWAAADTLLRTTDGGSTWQERALPDGTPLRAVRFANASEGWALSRQGGRLWHTRDGGQSWARTAPLPVDETTALALLGNGRLLVNGIKAGQSGAPFTLLSDDAGATWRTSARFVYPDQVATDGSLWAMADGVLWQSVDGGRSFTKPPVFGDSPGWQVGVLNGRVVASLVQDDPALFNSDVRQLQQLVTPGGTWAPVALPPVPDNGVLTTVNLFDAGDWALAGQRTNNPTAPLGAWTLWHRQAGSAAWSQSPLPADPPGNTAYRFVDGRTVSLQVPNQAPRLSTDGGRSWAAGPAPSADATDPLAFMLRDGGGGLLAGYGGDGYFTGAERWYRSTDEGRSWQPLLGTAPNGDRITGLWMLDAQRGLAITSAGRWLDTTNAGRDWAPRHAAARLAGTPKDLQFTPGGTGWLVTVQRQPPVGFGPASPDVGQLFRSVDQGRSWTAVALPEPAANRVLGVQFVDDRNGFLRADLGCSSFKFTICHEQTWVTRDAGATWQAVGEVRALDFVSLMLSPTRGVRIAGTDPFSNTKKAYLTTDGGATWSEGVDLPGADMLNPSRLVQAAGRLWLLGQAYGPDAGTRPWPLLTSGDGGRNWAVQALPVPAELQPSLCCETVLNDIAFADERHGWIVGGQGLMLATTDGGATWVRQASGSRQTLLTVHARTSRDAWIGGSARSILATGSGGS